MSLIPRVIRPLASINIISCIRVSFVSGSPWEVPLCSNELVSELLTRICSQKSHMRKGPPARTLLPASSVRMLPAPNWLAIALQTAQSAGCSLWNWGAGPCPCELASLVTRGQPPPRAPGEASPSSHSSQTLGCRGSFRPVSRLPASRRKRNTCPSQRLQQ